MRSRPPALPSIDDVEIRDTQIAGVDGNTIRIRLYLPKSSQRPAPAMLWIHGGGFIIGTPEQDQEQSLELCRKLGYAVAAVNYRVAPEAAFPAPLNDCYAALSWLHQNAASLGVDAAKIAVGGGSAGAGLAAGLVLMALDRGEVPVNFQLLIYPMLDDRTTRRTDVEERSLRLWTTKSNRYGWATYLGQEPGGENTSEYAAPARRRDLSGLPPTWIGVGTCDLFHDEDVEYARRLEQAGVPCELYVVPGAFHGFEVAGSQKDVVRDFRRSYFEALRRAGG